MSNGLLKRLRFALERERGYPVKIITRAEWQAANHPTGIPTSLPSPLSPYARGLSNVDVAAVASSTGPWTGSPGFHVVRRDPKDAPNIYNTDSYDVVEDITTAADFRQVCGAAGLSPGLVNAAELSGFVFVIGPKKRSDHHSRTLPKDIQGAKRKPRARGRALRRTRG